jgi:hypothetical protein
MEITVKKPVLMTTAAVLCAGLTLGLASTPASASQLADQTYSASSTLPSYTVKPVAGTNRVVVSLRSGTVRHAGAHIEIVNQYGVVTEKIPLTFGVNGDSEAVSVSRIGTTTFEVESSFAAAPNISTRARKKKQGWEGSWDKCVSEAGLQGAGGGLLVGGLGGAAAGMVGSGVVSALLQCRNLPHKS